MASSAAVRSGYGWTVGDGIEGLTARNWTVRLEHLDIDLGSVSGTFNTAVAAVAAVRS